MARQDSTGGSETGRHRWPVVADARSRFRVVGPGGGDRGRESPYRSLPAAVLDGAVGANGGTPDQGLVDLKISLPSPEQTLQATPVLSSCPDCNAALALLRIIP